MLSSTSLITQRSWLQPLKSSTNAEWPDPGLSMGRECRSLGKNKCWEVVGPAQTVSDCVIPKVKELLESRNEYLNETEPIPVALILGFYMIGRSEKKCNPTLLITCEKKVPRQRALNIVMRSGLLGSYPGVLLAESARSPLAPRPAVSLGLAQLTLQGPEDEFKIYHLEPRSLSTGPCGMLIHVQVMHDELLGDRGATIGGLVYCENGEHERTFYGITVAHAFAPSTGDDLVSPGSDVDEVDSDEFAFYGEDNDEEEEDEAFIEMTSRGSASSSTLGQSLSDNFSINHRPTNWQKAFFQDTPLTINMSKVGKLYASSEDGPQASLDWAVIEIDPTFQGLDKIMRLYPSRIGRKLLVETRVRTCTGASGMLTGNLSCNMTLLKLPGSQTLQEVWVVRLDGNLNKGDCGSWIFDMDTAELYGHIVAGHLDSGIGYVVPAYDIFQDIRKRTGRNLTLVQTPLEELPPRSDQSVSKSRQDHLKSSVEANLGENELMYECRWNECLNAYTSLNRLNAHIARRSHGPQRSLDEYSEIIRQTGIVKEEERFRRPVQGEDFIIDASQLHQSDTLERDEEGFEDPPMMEQKSPISYISPSLQLLTRRIRKEVVKHLKEKRNDKPDRRLDLSTDQPKVKLKAPAHSNDHAPSPLARPGSAPSLLARPGSAPSLPKPCFKPPRTIPTPPRSAPRLDVGTRHTATPSSLSLNASESARRNSTPENSPAQFINLREQAEADGGSNLRPMVNRSLSKIETSNIDLPWGRLFDQNLNPTRRLSQLLRGLANYITKEFHPKRGFVVTPEKMAAFYQYYAVEDEVYPLFSIFKLQSHNTLSELFQKLNCEHFLAQEDPSMQPTIPALSPTGFERWMTMWILAYPDQEARRLKMVVATLPIDGDNEATDGKAERMPTEISRSLFPNKENSQLRNILNEAMSNVTESFDMSRWRKLSKPAPQTSQMPQLKTQGTASSLKSPSFTSQPSSIEIQSHKKFASHACTRATSPGEANPPSEILIVKSLPIDASEEDLKSVFSELPGYKRLGFYTGSSSCFVHFEGISDAENALHDLHGSFPVNHVKYSNTHISFADNILSLRPAHRRGSSKSLL